MAHTCEPPTTESHFNVSHARITAAYIHPSEYSWRPTADNGSPGDVQSPAPATTSKSLLHRPPATTTRQSGVGQGISICILMGDPAGRHFCTSLLDCHEASAGQRLSSTTSSASSWKELLASTTLCYWRPALTCASPTS